MATASYFRGDQHKFIAKCGMALHDAVVKFLSTSSGQKLSTFVTCEKMSYVDTILLIPLSALKLPSHVVKAYGDVKVAFRENNEHGQNRMRYEKTEPALLMAMEPNWRKSDDSFYGGRTIAAINVGPSLPRFLAAAQSSSTNKKRKAALTELLRRVDMTPAKIAHELTHLTPSTVGPSDKDRKFERHELEKFADTRLVSKLKRSKIADIKEIESVHRSGYYNHPEEHSAQITELCADILIYMDRRPSFKKFILGPKVTLKKIVVQVDEEKEREGYPVRWTALFGHWTADTKLSTFEAIKGILGVASSKKPRAKKAA